MLTIFACDLVDYGLQDPDVEEPAPVDVIERFEQAAMPGLDVLFVVDGTGSMAEEQTQFAAEAAVFLARLDDIGLAWQIGVTTTDPADAGALVGRPWILTPGLETPDTDLAAALAIGTAHLPPSSGLDAAALALADAEGVNQGFRRDDAALHVVFVSDGDDQSGVVLGADPVGSFVELLAAETFRTGRAARASAVVGESPGGCDGAHGSAQAGTRYLAVAAATSGAAVSICDATFDEVAQAVTDLGVDWPTTFALQAVPEVGTVLVEVDGVRVSEWALSLDPPAIVFDVAPVADAEIVVRYRIASGT